MYRRIRIIGSAGSGKTTAARRLARKWTMNHIELDELSRDRETKKLRSEEDKEALLNKILNENKEWIVEGINIKGWCKKSFDDAELILFLDYPLRIRQWRVVRRFFRTRRGIEEKNHSTKFRALLRLLKWNLRFDKRRVILQERLNASPAKIIVFEHPDEFNEWFKTQWPR